jgi:hypothetical protein
MYVFIKACMQVCILIDVENKQCFLGTFQGTLSFYVFMRVCLHLYHEQARCMCVQFMYVYAFMCAFILLCSETFAQPCVYMKATLGREQQYA